MAVIGPVQIPWCRLELGLFAAAAKSIAPPGVILWVRAIAAFAGTSRTCASWAGTAHAVGQGSGGTCPQCSRGQYGYQGRSCKHHLVNSFSGFPRVSTLGVTDTDSHQGLRTFRTHSPDLVWRSVSISVSAFAGETRHYLAMPPTGVAVRLSVGKPE